MRRANGVPISARKSRLSWAAFLYKSLINGGGRSPERTGLYRIFPVNREFTGKIREFGSDPCIFVEPIRIQDHPGIHSPLLPRNRHEKYFNEAEYQAWLARFSPQGGEQ